MLRQINKRLTRIVYPNMHRYDELKQILCEFAEQRGLTKDTDTETEFKATWKYHNTPFATINLKYTGENPTFSFEPYGYLTRHGFRGKLTELSRDSTDVIVYFNAEDPNEYFVPLQKAPDMLRGRMQIMRQTIDKYVLFVEGIEEIKARIPYVTTVTCDDVKEGKFEMSGSSPYMELSLTIEHEDCVCLMKSTEIETRRETYSMQRSPKYNVERDIMHYIQSILLKKCSDILNEIHQSLRVTATKTHIRDTDIIGDIDLIYGSIYTYRNDDQNKLELHIQHTFDKDPCIALIAENTVERITQEPIRYRVSFDAIQVQVPARTYILIDQFETICTQYIKPFSST